MYRAGLMACVLVQKHPKTKWKILGKSWPLLIASWKVKATLRTNSIHQTPSIEKKLLQLSSNYEWSSHPLLDELYLKILTYFYFKGVIYGMFKHTTTANRINSQNVNQFLVPLVNKFTQEIKRLGINPYYAL